MADGKQTHQQHGGLESFSGGPELIQLYYNGYPRPVLVLRCQHCHPVGGECNLGSCQGRDNVEAQQATIISK